MPPRRAVATLAVPNPGASPIRAGGTLARARDEDRRHRRFHDVIRSGLAAALAAFLADQATKASALDAL
ncbi:hypothetical protein ACE7GA_00270 [Roseomonas sp. CCTCC AB2023176]|uniref:hypothetical protein n=1 Tax=Roseomonas sp. CCTCC AB2023176 TaxID=3342640 RepID=UPI0035D63D16